MKSSASSILKTDIDRDGTQLIRTLFQRGRQRLAERFGVTLSVHGDFAAFSRVDREGWHTFQAYTDEHSHASRGIALIVSDATGPIATYACALYDAHPDMATVIDERGFYDDGTGDRFEIVDSSARQWFEAMRGRVACSGGIWVKPSHRKTPLSRTLVPFFPLLGRAIAVECWRAEHVFALMPEDVVTKQIASRYRLSFMEPGIEWRHDGERLPFWFGYHAPLLVTRDAMAFLQREFEVLDPGATGRADHRVAIPAE